jgi:hypothetical protein
MSLQELEISERIHIMEAYYDLNALLEDRIDNQSIATYYKRSDFFYNLVHSRGGHSIHMGLSDDGFYKKSDFTQQAKFMHPRLIKFMRRFFSEDVTMNGIAGWLMLMTVDGTNIHQYCRGVGTK